MTLDFSYRSSSQIPFAEETRFQVVTFNENSFFATINNKVNS